MPTVPKSKKKPVSKQKALGWIFGPGIDAFNPNFQPVEEDVIRLWIKFYDTERGNDFKLTQERKDKVINGVVDALIDNWNPIPVQPKDAVFTIVQDLINEAEKKIKHYGRCHNDEEWIQDTRSLFVNVLNISEINMDIDLPEKMDTKDTEV